MSVLISALIGALEYRAPPVSPPPPPPPPPPPAVPLAAVLDPTYAYGERLGPGEVETWRCTLATIGGVLPYNYTAARVSGDTLTPVVSGNQVWFSTTLTNGQTKSSVYSFTVTDYDYTAVTKNISVELASERTGPTGPGGLRRETSDPLTREPTTFNPASDIVVFATPSYAYGERTGAGNVTTDTLVFNISGGTPPYAISTTYIQGDSFTINGGNTTNVSFTKTGLAENDNFVGWYRFLATDFNGYTGSTVVAAQLRAWASTVTPTPPTPPPPPPPPPQALAATASPTTVTGERLGSGFVTTNSVTITPSGGTPPYSYTMVYESGNSFTINNPSAGVYNFSKFLAADDYQTGVYRWTVTDSAVASVTGLVTAVLFADSITGPGLDRDDSFTFVF
jgi:hypothetical protein